MDREKVKSIRGLILFTAVIILGILYFKEVYAVAALLMVIIRPFLIGAAIAFVLNIPMKAIEKLLFSKAKGKFANKIKRPVSILLTLFVVVALLVMLFFTVVPQLSKTIMDLGYKIPIFLNEAILWIEVQFASYPEILEQIQQFETQQIDWNSLITMVVNFLRSGLSNMLTSTFSMASSIVAAVVNIVVSLIFSIYILSQKERLGNQVSRIISAYFPEKVNRSIFKVLKLAHSNFSNFISGQCLEAIILGAMFVVAMIIGQFPYALLVGTLIAFTALIPIVGAFVGCAVGAFLIMVDDPIKAIWFIILFLVLQQIEGNLIYPKVVGGTIGLPSIWVLAAVSVGGSLMGIMGMLLFIPLVSTCYSLIREDVNRIHEKRRSECIKAESIEENQENNQEEKKEEE